MALRGRFTLIWILLILAASVCFGAEPEPATVSAFNTYVGAVESRLAQDHRSARSFLEPSLSSSSLEGMRLRNGEFVIEQISPPKGATLPGALVHDWRGTAFIAGANTADFERLLRDFDRYPQYFSPEVLQTKVVAQHDGEPLVLIRVKQRHVITVTLDTTYDVAFGRLDSQHAYSTSRSVRISEVMQARTARGLDGLLWRLNTYWSFEERDGGLYIQIESVSLTPSIPYGLRWAVAPYVESIPRESLEFTLRSASNALRRRNSNQKGQ